MESLRNCWEIDFMRDTITSLIENYDSKGRYLDRDGVDQLKRLTPAA